MATGITRPDGTEAGGWAGSQSPNHEGINQGVTQPTAPDAENVTANDGDENDVDRYTFDNSIDDVDEVTQIKFWIYVQQNGNTWADINVDLGGWLGVVRFSPAAGPGWSSQTRAGLSGTQADLDGLRIQLTADSDMGKTAFIAIREIYAEVTYTAVPVGYGHKVNGVAPANIAKVNGILTANIAKVNGV